MYYKLPDDKNSTTQQTSIPSKSATSATALPAGFWPTWKAAAASPPAPYTGTKIEPGGRVRCTFRHVPWQSQVHQHVDINGYPC
ncbi:hypothetical protein Ga0100231_016835 [Opitutaceae bacterium TAV4]|nr:hypothetical protein Ga0100231_016835 [Opitutaceae bacterium TAV4]RRK02117.1 hypothetical protein Ga0100230_002640 [Opitutaceae bacterium TAV3]